MSGKFMRVKRVVIPTITMLLIASQLGGCACGSSSEFLNMYERQESITIEIAEPISQEQGTERSYEWTELAYLTTYPEFREVFDDELGIINQGANGKNGVVYVDLEGNHTNNSTLRYAFANQKFLDKCWNNTSGTMKTLVNAVKDNFVDVESDAMARLAILNTYFNILADAEPNYFNGNQTLTRGEFLAAVYRAETPVTEIAENNLFKSLVDPAGTDETTIFANQMLDYSYLSTDDESLNASTYVGKISRAEAIYTLVMKYYPEEYAKITGKESCYSDAKNGGDIASKQGFNKDNKKYGKAYELNYAIKYESKGLPDDLYKALVVAKNHNIISGTESRWADAVTKAELLNFLVRVYENLGTVTSADRGASTGNIVNNQSSTGNVGNNTESTENQFHIDENDFYYDEEGRLHYSDELIAFVESFNKFDGLNTIVIKRVIETMEFEGIFNFGKTFNDIQGTLESSLSDDEIAQGLINIAMKNFAIIEGDNEVNSGGGEVNITDKDSNKGGSDENEKTPEDEFVSSDLPNTNYDEDEKPEVEVNENSKYTFTDIDKNMYATDTVNVRKGPSTDYDKCGNLIKGQKVYVVKQCNETGWFMIMYGDTLAYVTDTYISATAPATPTPAKPTQAPAKTTDTPKPTGVVTLDPVVENNIKGSYVNGSFVPSYSGTYIDGFLVLDGLEEYTGEIPMKSNAEIRAWKQKYPGLGYVGLGTANTRIVIGTVDGGELEGNININFN